MAKKTFNRKFSSTCTSAAWSSVTPMERDPDLDEVVVQVELTSSNLNSATVVAKIQGSNISDAVAAGWADLGSKSFTAAGIGWIAATENDNILVLSPYRFIRLLVTDSGGDPANASKVAVVLCGDIPE